MAQMDYANAARSGQGHQRPQGRHDGMPQPIFHLPYLFGQTFIVNFKAAKPAATRNELAIFVLQCLPLLPIEVISVYTDHVTRLFVTVDSEPVFEAALAALRAKVTWTTTGGAILYGWSTEEALTQVRVSNVPPFLSTGRSSCGAHRLFPRVADGVIHLSMHLDNADRLPVFLQLVDEDGHLAASLAVHTDSRHRHCYKCGDNHVAAYSYSDVFQCLFPNVAQYLFFRPNMLHSRLDKLYVTTLFAIICFIARFIPTLSDHSVFYAVFTPAGLGLCLEPHRWSANFYWKIN
jgi:hypothetical protein